MQQRTALAAGLGERGVDLISESILEGLEPAWTCGRSGGCP
ncbi:hypothetical protein [Nocardia tengchongensis]